MHPSGQDDPERGARIAALRVDILEEYETLNVHLAEMSKAIREVATEDVPALMDQLREIERKFTLVYTLFRSSIYDVVARSDSTYPSLGLSPPRGGGIHRPPFPW
ncbi:MAG: DASH complex subunit Dad3-domain-containing protein [Piptocephalis tieghemiana]|nr:MAG: DASH complex subunit Dad3-domain-containing protein [Piptocephalis tieghemiana]